ncbi:glycosyltransferase family 2 protein [Brevibacterium aurantiacum]|uniref:Glycosyltransferase 2-like domain-containing protein n=1 Tax=Brevibacterium aurantiacum TaxID=273384 RepID=A0A2A3ZRS3_BREAU|nr:glycosyltransferase family 2 protein [Brevibacterium aurantiacum]PCC54065.1 hypothetical protein CIK59_09915 [Brevibacterium aurantiacum]
MSESTVATDHADTRVRLSIIIPVYNNEDHIRRSVETAAKQTVAGGSTEVVVINDGSTDGTTDILDQLKTQHENLQVVHQENSGWAGGPRNTGFDLAKGDYVFFHDADDQLNGDCLGSAVEYADDHHSDVVAVKIEGRGGRYTHMDVFESTQEDGDIRKLVRSNFVFKLFRRSFLAVHHLRFPAHNIRLEDAQFCFRAYSLASRVSILSDRTYYFVWNHGTGHISHSRAAPDAHAQGIRRSLEPLRADSWEDDVRREAMADFFRRVILARFNDRFPKESIDFRLGWVRESSQLARDFAVPERLHEYYGKISLARLWSALRANPALVEAVSRQFRRDHVVISEVDDVRTSGLHLELRGTAAALISSESFSELRILMKQGGKTVEQLDAELTSSGDIAVETLELSNQAQRFVVRIPKRVLLRHRSVKLYSSALDGSGTRTKTIRVGLAADTSTHNRRSIFAVEVFPTRLRGLSIRSGFGVARRLKRLLRGAKTRN